MKKLIMMTILLVSSFVFSATLQDGRYAVISNSKGIEINMSIIVKKNKIISMDFDKKTETGVSISLTPNGKEFREKKTVITREVIRQNSLDGIEIDFDTNTSKEFKKLFMFLIEKSKNGETGTYEI